MSDNILELWDRQNYDVSRNLIIKSYDLDEFNEANSAGLFETDLTNIYSLSANSCSHKNNIKIIKKLISIKMNLGSSDSIDFIEKINSNTKLLNYFEIIEYLKSYQHKSSVEELLIEKYLILFEYLSNIFHSFINQSPLLWGENWLKDPFSNQKFLESIFKPNISVDCPIISNAAKKYEQVKMFFDLSSQSNRFKKLAIFSGYFLVSCEVSIINKDFTLATLLLHRSMEILYIYWLLEDGELHLNNDGTVNSENYIYLSGYLKKVKLTRSVNDIENTAVELLNKLRNSNKLTHGFNIISEDKFNESFNILKPYILKDDNVKNSYSALISALSMDECCYNLAYEYLIKKLFFEKLY